MIMFAIRFYAYMDPVRPNVIHPFHPGTRFVPAIVLLRTTCYLRVHVTPRFVRASRLFRAFRPWKKLKLGCEIRNDSIRLETRVTSNRIKTVITSEKCTTDNSYLLGNMHRQSTRISSRIRAKKNRVDNYVYECFFFFFFLGRKRALGVRAHPSTYLCVRISRAGIPYNSADRCKSIKGRLGLTVFAGGEKPIVAARRQSHATNITAASAFEIASRTRPPRTERKRRRGPRRRTKVGYRKPQRQEEGPATRRSMTEAENPAGTEGAPEAQDIGRRHAIPIVHVRGTHYDIGFDIGRTFSGLIQSFLKVYRPLNETYLPLYETEIGKKIYEETLACAEEQFPGYLKEIRGTADGANVPFHKLFLIHLDDIVPNVMNQGTQNTLPVGCSTIMCNQPGQEILGHNEDALSETLNHWYLVSAHVVEPGCKEEIFTSLSYAGFLPGYTMGYNRHGLVYTINTLSAATLRSGKTPRYFITRALLAAENYVEAQQILRNEGYGAAEGFSVNMTFLSQEGDRMFHNAEVGPCEENGTQSQLSMLTIGPGENTIHCNKYLRLKITEVGGLIIDSSEKRMEALCKHPPPKSRQDVINMLSDQTDEQYRVYQEKDKNDAVKTIATGIFDCIERTWSIYTGKPSEAKPILVIPLRLDDEPTTIPA